MELFIPDKFDGTILVVYNNHRLPDDPLKPFVITSSDNKLWLKSQIWKFGKDQRIGKDGSACLDVLLPH